jgi:hypothetical protein
MSGRKKTVVITEGLKAERYTIWIMELPMKIYAYEAKMLDKQLEKKINILAKK